ncbi:biopolymer transporter ExbB [Actibacterium sp. MT2.3-13A]|uniref:biopolymer transporter ExbB n=1 Tax=Actibacterium sp. MT2.3-13A TaxID=2828332 RepID=UPI001BAAD38E|nr:biopolymer transporter ExbB [Actibacterium sp. MT2.3-13A]
MDMSEREAEPHFSQPVRQIFTMLVAVGLFSFGAYVAFPRVAPVFLANPYLNGVIALVFLIGVLACFLQVIQLVTSVGWIEGFIEGRPGHEITRAPRLLAPLAALLRARGKRMKISTSSARSILESVATRIEEARDITRYIVNLLIFLGLLGTFYGLATTVPAVVETIRSLAPQDGEGGVEVFSRLMTGLEAQLGGMGTAFSSSLLGLAGSLVVGLLELFAGHGQNRFYRELEEWLSTITRLGFATAEAGEGGETGALAGVLEQMAQQMDTLQGMVARSETGRAEADAQLAGLAQAMDRLSQRLEEDARTAGGTARALAQIADGQERMIAALEGRAEEGGAHMDAESRMRLRSIDVQLLRILEELSAGRQETLTDLRGDLAALTRAIRQRNTGQGS